MAAKSKKEPKSTPTGAVSMTGFGRAAERVAPQGIEIEVEIRASNHRFLDLTFKLPRGYQEFEQELRAEIAARLERGRIEVSVQRRGGTEQSAGSGDLVFNRKSFDELYSLYEWLYREKSGIATEELGADTVRAILLEILRRSEVLTSAEEAGNFSVEKAPLMLALGKACEALDAMRRKEGASIGKDIESRRSHLVALAAKLRDETAASPEELKRRLTQRLKRVAPEILADPQRVAAEIALMSDKIDVTEELVRLGSHLEQFSKALGTPPSGKRLDFLIQEIGREFNTIGSKVQHAPAQSLVVEAKVELEKIREQVQNVI